MQNKLKSDIDKRLSLYLRHLKKNYSLGTDSSLLFKNLADFILRPGKRIRPTLLVIGYLGFAGKTVPNLYTTALAIELLHDFMLVHDDIIDKSHLRRGKPAMHKMLDKYLKRHKTAKFSGQDLAIVAGDVMYAMAIDSFLSIKADPRLKEKALRRFIRAAVYTGMGEFIELLEGIKDIKRVTKQDIYKIYDYKTAHYTFAAPLSCGAILAGANQRQVNRLHRYGIYLGRAFQIRDDILGMFGEEKEIGKSSFSDLQEAKKTLLIWYAYNHASRSEQRLIRKTFTKTKINRQDLLTMRKLIRATGALAYARKEVLNLIKKAETIIKASAISLKYKTFLLNYFQKLLTHQLTHSHSRR